MKEIMNSYAQGEEANPPECPDPLEEMDPMNPYTENKQLAAAGGE